MFFWELFRFRNERNIIPFILLPIAEWTKWTEYGLLGIRRIRVLLGNFWREFPTRPPAPVAWLPVGRRSSSQVTSAMSIPFSEWMSVLLEIPCILLSLNRNRNSQNSLKRMHPKFQSFSILAIRSLWCSRTCHSQRRSKPWYTGGCRLSATQATPSVITDDNNAVIQSLVAKLDHHFKVSSFAAVHWSYPPPPPSKKKKSLTCSTELSKYTENRLLLTDSEEAEMTWNLAGRPQWPRQQIKG